MFTYCPPNSAKVRVNDCNFFLTLSLLFVFILGTPISRPPVLGNQDLDLHRLYKIVQENGGMEKVAIK